MRRRHSLIVIVGILINGCSSDLNRSTAKKLLMESSALKEVITDVAWRTGGMEEWISRGAMTNRKIATGVSEIKYYGVRFGVPVQRTIEEVTGIFEGTGRKTVQFRWSLTGVPPSLKRLIVAGSMGQANFVKYDDGWRLENSAFEANNREPLRLTPQEAQEKQSDLEQVAQQVKESSTQTKVIADYSLDSNKGTKGHITDVGLTATSDGSIWFRCINSMNGPGGGRFPGQYLQSSLASSRMRGQNAFSNLFR